MKDWVIVKDENDFPKCEEGQQNKFYVVVCKGGKTKVAFPDNSYGLYVWNALNGSMNDIWHSEVVAYQEIDVPKEVIDLVLANNKSKNSHFAKFYK